MLEIASRQSRHFFRATQCFHQLFVYVFRAVGSSRTHRQYWLYLLGSLIFLSMMPSVAGDLSTEHQTLNLVCSNDDCSLSEDAVGDAMLTGEERGANPLQPVTVSLEFPMRPDQTSVTLLPGFIESMMIDFRIQTVVI